MAACSLPAGAACGLLRQALIDGVNTWWAELGGPWGKRRSGEKGQEESKRGGAPAQDGGRLTPVGKKWGAAGRPSSREVTLHTVSLWPLKHIVLLSCLKSGGIGARLTDVGSTQRWPQHTHPHPAREGPARSLCTRSGPLSSSETVNPPGPRVPKDLST